MLEYLKAHPAEKVPVYDKLRVVIIAIFLRYVLRRSWNAISRRNGLQLLTDHIHINDISALMVTDLIEGFIKEKHL